MNPPQLTTTMFVLLIITVIGQSLGRKYLDPLWPEKDVAIKTLSKIWNVAIGFIVPIISIIYYTLSSEPLSKGYVFAVALNIGIIAFNCSFELAKSHMRIFRSLINSITEIRKTDKEFRDFMIEKVASLENEINRITGKPTKLIPPPEEGYF